MITNDFNKVILTGRAMSLPELNYTGDGTPVTNFTIRTFGRKNDEIFDVTVWGELARRASEEILLNEKLLVEGSLHTRIYKREDTAEKAYEISARRIFSLNGEFSEYEV